MRPGGKGFTLVELAVALVILGILLALGLPGIATYSRNIKVRAAAESFLAGVQLARGEAVRGNVATEIILTNDAPSADDGSSGDYPSLEEGALISAGPPAVTEMTGRLAANQPAAHASTAVDPSYNWLVRTRPTAGGNCGTNAGVNATPDPAQQAKACWFIMGKRGAEGGGVSDADSPVLIEGPASVIFSPLGTANGAAEFNFSSPAGGTCALAGGVIRCLRVRVEAGGRAKLCDPAATAVGDTRGC